MAGLGPAPGLAPYATSKHAVVGLTRALRAEASPHGVRVSVLCPGWVDTPILDQDNPPDLQTSRGPEGGMRRTLSLFGLGAPVPAEKVAAAALAGLARDRAQIVTPSQARVAATVGAALPQLAARRAAQVFTKVEQAWRTRV